MENRGVGKLFEEFAVRYLSDKGYKVIEQNYRFRRFGEVDIIAKIDNLTCFIEVKSRQNNYFGTPAEAVTYKKKNKITFLANHYLAQNNLSNKAVRFDVIEIYFTRNPDATYTVKVVNHIENAF